MVYNDLEPSADFLSLGRYCLGQCPIEILQFTDVLSKTPYHSTMPYKHKYQTPDYMVSMITSRTNHLIWSQKHYRRQKGIRAMCLHSNILK